MDMKREIMVVEPGLVSASIVDIGEVETKTISKKIMKRERSKVASNGMTYADWLTKAIESNIDRKLTLAEIYDWMCANVPGLSGQRYLHSSKGWKNAVRHTLSVNARFCKIARPGRPSFWATATVKQPPTSDTQPISNGQQIETKNRKKRTRTISSPVSSLSKVDQEIEDHKRFRTQYSNSTDYSNLTASSANSSTSITPPARTPKLESNDQIYMIEYYQIPLALAAVAAQATHVFKPKPTSNFRTSPTSAFVSFRARQEG